jgi:hypothetical protein
MTIVRPDGKKILDEREKVQMSNVWTIYCRDDSFYE